MKRKKIITIIFLSIFILSFGAGNKDKKNTTSSAVGNEERNRIIENEYKEGNNEIIVDDEKVIIVTSVQAVSVKNEKPKEKAIVAKEEEKEEIKAEKIESKPKINQEEIQDKSEPPVEESRIPAEKKAKKPLYTITLTLPIKTKQVSQEQKKQIESEIDVEKEISKLEKKYGNESEKKESTSDVPNKTTPAAVNNPAVNEIEKAKEEKTEGRALIEAEREKIAESYGDGRQWKDTNIKEKNIGKYNDKSKNKKVNEDKKKASKMNSVIIRGGVNLKTDITLDSDIKELKLNADNGFYIGGEYQINVNRYVKVGAGAVLDSDVKIKSEIKDYKQLGMMMMPVYAFMKFKTDTQFIDPFIKLKCGYSLYGITDEALNTTRIDRDIYFGADAGLEIRNFIVETGYSMEKYIAIDKTTEQNISIYYPKLSAGLGYKIDF